MSTLSLQPRNAFNSLGEIPKTGAARMPEARPLRRAAFLDRDGTICEEMGYVNHVDRMRIFPFAAAAIRQLNEAHIPVIVVTNQSGVARDIFPESLVHQVHKKMISELSAACGARVDAI